MCPYRIVGIDNRFKLDKEIVSVKESEDALGIVELTRGCRNAIGDLANGAAGILVKSTP